MSKEVVHCRSSKIIDGEFVDHPGQEVGNVLPDGTIENTDYKFKKRKVVGGVAVTDNSRLVRDLDTLINPATGERFKRTKKGTGFFSWLSQTFVKPYLEEDAKDRD